MVERAKGIARLRRAAFQARCLLLARRRGARGGFALISVLWGIALLALLAAGVSSDSRTQARIARNVAEKAEAQALADAGIQRAIAELLEPDRRGRWRLDGTVYPFAFAGAEIRVSIQSEAGKVDLNTASPQLLAGLFRAAGADPQRASALAGAVVDWRDPDDLVQLNGAEASAYAGPGPAPRNGPFRRVEELLLVLGMTPELFAAAEPALTVFSTRAEVDRAVAPRLALLGTPDMTPEAAEAILAERGTDSDQLHIVQGGDSFTVRAEATAGGSRAMREAVIQLTDDLQHPYWIRVWRERRPASAAD